MIGVDAMAARVNLIDNRTMKKFLQKTTIEIIKLRHRKKRLKKMNKMSVPYEEISSIHIIRIPEEEWGQKNFQFLKNINL